MSDDNVALVRGMYEAFDQGNVPAIIGALAENVSWASPRVLPHGGMAHGHEEVLGFFQRLSDKWDGFQVEVQDFVSADDRVFVIGRATETSQAARFPRHMASFTASRSPTGR